MGKDAEGCGRMQRDALSDLAAVMQCHSGSYSNCRSGDNWSDLWSDFISGQHNVRGKRYNLPHSAL